MWHGLSRRTMAGGMQALEEIRSITGHSRTTGLSDDTIAEFLLSDPLLSRALEEASANFHSILDDMGPEVLSMDED